MGRWGNAELNKGLENLLKMPRRNASVGRE